jgi:hypothetical protein
MVMPQINHLKFNTMMMMIGDLMREETGEETQTQMEGAEMAIMAILL